jgi:hypothetical protein
MTLLAMASHESRIAIARRWIECAKEIASRARSAADLRGDRAPLEAVIETAMTRLPEARFLEESPARAELAAIDRESARQLDRFFGAPWSAEARARSLLAGLELEIAGRKDPLARAMLRYRSADEDERRAARAAIDRALDEVRERHPIGGLIDALRPREDAPAPRQPAAPVLQSTASGLVLPSADLIAGLSDGSAGIDVALLAAMTQAQPAAPSPIASPAPALGSAGENALGSPGPSSLLPLIRELGESVVGARPETFGAWRAAAAGIDVADFRPSPQIAVLAALEATIALPFERPWVPLGRKGAVCSGGTDATSSIARMIGAGAALGDRAIGGALALALLTRPFLQRALREPPRDRDRAARTIALATMMALLDAQLAERAAGDVDALRDGYQDAIDCAPSMAIAAWWVDEHALQAAPGEDTSVYAHGGYAVTDAILRGTSLAGEMRERFDEDWFRNPRATIGAVAELASSSRSAGEHDVVRWTRDAVF